MSRTAPAAPILDQDADGLATFRRVAAGAALAAGTVLYAVGAATSPDQDDMSTKGYVESLAADPGMSDLSAATLHWGWALMVPGLIAAMALVRGRRGRVLTALGGTLGVLGAINISGLVMSDFFNAHGPGVIGVDGTVEVMEAAMASPGLALWSLVGRAGAALGVPLLLAGLWRAGVIGWWAAPLFLLGGVLPFVVPGLWAVPAVVVTSLPGLVLARVLVQRGAPVVVAAETQPVREPALV